MWGGDAATNETVIGALAEKYGQTLTVTAGVLGCFGILVDICGFLQFYACWYLMLVSAASVKIMIDNLENTFPSKQAWKYFRDLQLVCRELDDVFGIVFKILHLYNTMVFAYFLLYWFIKGEYNIFLFLTSLDTVLILVAYYAAGKVASKVIIFVNA